MSQEILRTDFTAQPNLSALEKEVLVQYQALANKLGVLLSEVARLHKAVPRDQTPTVLGSDSAQPQQPAADSLLKNMHALEMKIGLVYTMFRTAVYSLLLQNQESQDSDASP